MKQWPYDEISHTRGAILEQTKRTVYKGGHVWAQIDLLVKA